MGRWYEKGSQVSNLKVIIILSAFVFLNLSQASVVVSPITKLSEINSYSGSIDGDTLIKVDTPHSSCPGGYWLKITDLGFEKNISILLSAFHTQSNLMIRANNESKWPHSPNNAYCRISQIQLFR